MSASRVCSIKHPESSGSVNESIWQQQDIAAFIKKEFDKKYNPTWHCVEPAEHRQRARAEQARQ